MKIAATTEIRTGRIHNFGAGPAVLPEVVLEQVQAELLSYSGGGMSVMELSHFGPPKRFVTFGRS